MIKENPDSFVMLVSAAINRRYPVEAKEEREPWIVLGHCARRAVGAQTPLSPLVH